MSKFTPGPWKALFSLMPEHLEKVAKKRGMDIPDCLTNDGARAVVSEDSSRICLVDSKSTYKRGEGYKSKCEQRDGNAHLIAAAPEMYDFIATLENDDGKIPDWLWEKRNEILAKATGKEK